MPALCRHAAAGHDGYIRHLRERAARVAFARPVRDGRLRVGFVGPTYRDHGGTETWHQTLLPRLGRTDTIRVVGYAVLDGGGDAMALGCPLGVGEPAIRALAACVDVLVCWGMARPGAYLPAVGPRPYVVVVGHGDGASAWSRSILAAADVDADRFVVVHPVCLDTVPPHRRAGAAVLPNALDPRRIPPTPSGASRALRRSRLGLSHRFAVLCLSRLSPEKGVGTLVTAMRSVPDLDLVVVGDGFERGPLEAAAPRNVRFVGARPAADVADWLAAADVLASPSTSEGFGLSVAEAWGAGLPVVATPVGVVVDHPQFVRLVPVGAGPAAWVEALRRDRDDGTARRQRAAEALAVAWTEFDPCRHARAWESFLLTLGDPPVRS